MSRTQHNGDEASVDRQVSPGGSAARETLPSFEDDLLGFMEACARTLGDVALLDMAGQPTAIVSDPNLIHDLFTRPFSEVSEGPDIALDRLVLGDSILTNYSESWRPRRLVVQRPLAHRSVQVFADLIVAAAIERFERWNDLDELDVVEEMMELTFGIVSTTLFSDEIRDLKPLVDAVNEGRLATFEAAYTTGGTVERTEALEGVLGDLDEALFAVISQRRLDGVARGDLLDMLLRAVDEDGKPMSDREVRDEAVTLIFAGHETTAAALGFALDGLARHPELQSELQEDVDRELGQARPSLEKLEAVPLARQVIDETLRLYPPVFMGDRAAAVDLELAGQRIAAGTTILLSIWNVHHDGRYFDDPLRFDPKRFAEPARARIQRFAYLPFGGGPKICAGNHLALLETTLVLLCAMQRFTFELLDPSPLRLRTSAVLLPEGGIKMRVRTRR